MPTPFARYLSLILLALALVLPYAVANHTYPIPTFYAEFTALVLYLLMSAGPDHTYGPLTDSGGGLPSDDITVIGGN